MQQMPTFHLITGRDALDRHAIDKGSSGLLDGDYLAKRHVLVCEGDWTLAETLRLDWTPDWCSRTWLTRLGIDEAVDADGIAGMLVLGDLVIDGALINADIDSGPFLVVQGNLTARAVASGGAGPDPRAARFTAGMRPSVGAHDTPLALCTDMPCKIVT